MKYITPSLFPQNITCGFSTKAYGPLAPFGEKMGGAWSDETTTNRLGYFTDLGLSQDDVVELKQCHSDRVVVVKKEHAGQGFIDEADALITDQKNVGLAVFASDCVPTFIYDPENGIIAAIHSGWRGVYSEIVPKTIKRMVVDFASTPKDLLVWVGPHISRESYKFPLSDFEGEPANLYFEQKGGIKRTDTDFHVDLGKVVTEQLLETGIDENNIEISHIDTKTDEALYSYQGGERINNMGVIMMKS